MKTQRLSYIKVLLWHLAHPLWWHVLFTVMMDVRHEATRCTSSHFRFLLTAHFFKSFRVIQNRCRHPSPIICVIAFRAVRSEASACNIVDFSSYRQSLVLRGVCFLFVITSAAFVALCVAISLYHWRRGGVKRGSIENNFLDCHMTGLHCIYDDIFTLSPLSIPISKKSRSIIGFHEMFYNVVRPPFTNHSIGTRYPKLISCE